MDLVRNFSMSTANFSRGPVRIIQVGCGGTGSYIVPAICQYVSTSPYKDKIEIILIDGDIVEQKNLVRQRFITQDLNRNKAEVLAERYSAAFGVNIKSLAEYLEPEKHFSFLNSNTSTIVIGAVDNHNARLKIASIVSDMSYQTICIDTGNGMWNGQVNLYTNNRTYYSAYNTKALFERPESVLPVLNIPPPMFCDFALMEKTVTDFLITDQCAVNAEANSQTINANMLSAQCAVSYLYQILGGAVDSFALFFDAKSGTVRSVPINKNTWAERESYLRNNRALYSDFRNTHSDNPLFKCASSVYRMLNV